MERYTQFLLRHKKLIIGVFVLGALLCAVLSGLVGVNYDFADYLPDKSASTRALEVMEDEYSQSIPNMRVLVYDVTIPQALAVKAQIAAVDGVEEINWLDDAADIYEPLETVEQKITDDWYKGTENALFSVTVDEAKGESVIPAVRQIIGGENCMEGSAVTSVLAPVNTSREVQQIMLLAVPIIFLILILTTDSWFEPVLFMITIGVAILLNRGTNLMFGTISFVTNAAGSVLQLAVSMDYSIFLLHRFAENRSGGLPVEKAMTEAVQQSVGSILSSGLTTVTGFLALVLMRFKIGPDMGWVMSKAIAFSLLSVLCFLPALAIATYRLIDSDTAPQLVPKFSDKFAAVVMKISFSCAGADCASCFPPFLTAEQRLFTAEARCTARRLRRWEGICRPTACTAPPIRWCLWFPKGIWRRKSP